MRLALGIALPSLVAVLWGAIIFSEIGRTSPLIDLDNSWSSLMLASRTTELTNVNLVLNFFGEDGMYIFTVAVFLLLLIKHKRLAIFFAVANLATVAGTQLLKTIVDRTRPLDKLVGVDNGSYPSGHSSATVAAMLATALLLGRLWMWISAAVLSVAMLWSRTYLGAHWLSDTIAGALLATAIVLICWALIGGRTGAPITGAQNTTSTPATEK